jgi:hypothetical protein
MTGPFSFEDHLDYLNRMEFLFLHPDRLDVLRPEELEDLDSFDDPYHDEDDY